MKTHSEFLSAIGMAEDIALDTLQLNGPMQHTELFERIEKILINRGINSFDYGVRLPQAAVLSLSNDGEVTIGYDWVVSLGGSPNPYY